MPDIGDLLTSRPASCIQLLTDTQLIYKKNIVLIIIAFVLSFEVDGDVSLIHHKRIDFCKKKLSLVRDSWTIVPLNGWKFSPTHFPTMFRSDLGVPIDDEKKTRSANFDLQPKSVTFWPLMTYLCGSIAWYDMQSLEGFKTHILSGELLWQNDSKHSYSKLSFSCSRNLIHFFLGTLCSCQGKIRKS